MRPLRPPGDVLLDDEDRGTQRAHNNAHDALHHWHGVRRIVDYAAGVF